MKPLLCALLAAILAASAAAQDERPQTLDGFEGDARWEAAASDGVSAEARSVEGLDGRAIALDYDFNDVSGYAVLRAPVAVEDLPENYAISLAVRGAGPLDALEIKFLDESGDTVWWYRIEDFEPGEAWQEITFRKRQIAFAWGPERQEELTGFASVELVAVAGADSERGRLEFDALEIRELPVPPEVPPTPSASASAGVASALFDGDRETVWRAPAGPQNVTVDLGYEREFGGIVLDWVEGAAATEYQVLVSPDGETWSAARAVSRGNGGRDPLLMTESTARWLRLELETAEGEEYALREIEIRALDFGASPTAFFEAIAAGAERGAFPRGFSGEQPYWTLVGVDGGATSSALLSEDGALEIGPGGPSIEPALAVGGELVDWADVEIAHTLEDGYLPIPGVVWQGEGWRLHITAFADGTPDRPRFALRYRLENSGEAPLEAELVLAMRPFQVNGPRQFLNLAGGVSPIHALDWDGEGLAANDETGVRPLDAPARVELRPFDAGSELFVPAEGNGASPVTLDDPVGFASGALAFALSVPPGESREVGLVAAPDRLPEAPETDLAALQEEIAAFWHEELDTLGFDVPPEARPIVDTLRSSLAHMLMSRDGVVLQPGTRSYARSWIRDGAMMAEALARLGRIGIARDYALWYADHLFESGKVPCCVDARGPDPTPENDSHGEFVFLVAEIYRYTGDRAFLERLWPKVRGAAGYMEELVASERTPENLVRAGGAYYGLLPPSISHEGYSDKPAYSHWDNFWGLKGLRDAAWLAAELGLEEEAADLSARADTFRDAILASLDRTAELYDIDYIPGAADRGDFDATSTTIALSPAGLEDVLPRDRLDATFQRAWDHFLARRAGEIAWEDYTPYELRLVGAFVRLGWRERALDLLDFYMDDRRPQAWNQWAEVVGRDEREPRFIGDMPHAWIASDYIRAAFDLFAYADRDRALVLAAGLDPAWFGGEGLSVEDLPTPYGPLSYSLRRDSEGALHVRVEGEAAPPGGFRLPAFDVPTPARVNGETADWQDGVLVFDTLPAEIVIGANREE